MVESLFKVDIERVQKEYSEKMMFGVIVYILGSSVINKIGFWRVFMFEFNCDKCICCYFCYIYCLELVIYFDEEGYLVFDYDYCKGCGICVNECFVDVIVMVREIK